jgi:hypothetical protein
MSKANQKEAEFCWHYSRFNVAENCKSFAPFDAKVLLQSQRMYQPPD